MSNALLQAKHKLSLNQIQINDNFWNHYVSLVRNTVIPYQWDALNDRIPDAEPSHAIHNFRIAAGLETGEYHGWVFQDSDLAKWLEAVAYSLQQQPDAALEQTADETIDLIVQAQQSDGYLNTYFTIKEPGKRWTNLYECHELYCAGHMIEAAVAYFEATGKRKLLDAMCRFADHIQDVFGPEEGKIRGYDGHQEIELALIKLYTVTKQEKYLQLACYFIDERGQQPNFFDGEWERRGKTSIYRAGETPLPSLSSIYNQSHLPVREQDTATGHSVRAVYMYTAMADLARLTGDEKLLAACKKLWANMTQKQMYITGGIGSTHHGEAFSFDYDLPNDTVYAETCASIGLVYFAQRMLRLETRSEYADVIERALYNIIIGSMSQDGKQFFYVNPLEVWPQASASNPGKRHVKAERQKWFGCACCPPNLARILSSLGEYIYTTEPGRINCHLFIGSESTITLDDATQVGLKQVSSLPWSGDTSLELSLALPRSFILALRVPYWCDSQPQLFINGEKEDTYAVENGYAIIDRIWTDGDTVTWLLPMEAHLIQANPLIRSNAGKAAIQRGPLVYCVEQVDNGAPLATLSLQSGTRLKVEADTSALGGTVKIEAEGFRDATPEAWASAEPYRRWAPSADPVALHAVPYFQWGNRGVGEMAVWIRVHQ
ncbi:glycoside hydrolase family 127 protein [Paenibacillus chondroitinus]|uniref:Glycoside hydrolase family 127 protein n=1 Tax=Paenibacillus chondroitinus TaxID=59842 RepID=A0ABU6D5Y2_9BACL|nr:MULTISPECIES: beta-L-arabinofuranosidase domain-containing protein [Paenibacillus]MCY9660855.1 glycoside hydrolase family 127 protein [Paenibacillus anseongense]MEB4792347.1 glycoside hydrolase family 127 protein [Paenibacillus chondroitinus]